MRGLGPIGVGLLVALENLFPPIPSEVVLPVAGFVASQGGMSLLWVIVGATVGAGLLYLVGAAFGRVRIRRWLAKVPLIEVDDPDRAEAWFARRGGVAVLIGRCVPVVRSLISVPAGLEQMPLRRFLADTASGSAVWNSALVGAGYLVDAVIAILVARFVRTGLRRRRATSD